MSERLTDEQLRAYTHEGFMPQARSMAIELLAARAKLKSLGDIMNQYAKQHPVVRVMTQEIASIK